MPKYTVKLNDNSVAQLKRNIEEYKKSLTGKCRKMAQSLAEIGLNVAKVKVGESPLGKTITLVTETNGTQTGCKAMLIATGQTTTSEKFEPFHTLLAVEFGAGIHYNPTPNPKAAEFGLGVGTFPGQIHAFDDGWYFYDETKDRWIYTHGVKATMPMYNASLEIQARIAEKAKEIFGG